MSTTAVFGAGVMGEALVTGLLRGRWSPDNLVIAEKRPERAKELIARHGVRVLSNSEAASSADVLVLVVKPQDMATLLEEIRPSVRPDALVVSLAAGITTDFISKRLPNDIAVVRVMPNTPALVDEGMAAVSAGRHCTDEHLAQAEEMLRAVGKVVRVPEVQQDAVTAISGSGPAYIFFIVEAMIEAGVSLGLDREIASELTIQTLVGSAVMLRETGERPSVLRENVTSPGGTTVAALRELEHSNVHDAFLTAMEAARDRSKELAAG